MNATKSQVFSKNAISNGLAHIDGIFDLVDSRSHDPLIIDDLNWKKIAKMWTLHLSNSDINRLGSSTAEKILSILTSKNFRKGTVKQINLPKNQIDFLRTINNAINSGRPIEIVLPSFPFRINNSLKSTINNPGIAEATALAKIYSLVSAIKKVYPKGAIIHIGQDGVLYCSCFKHGERYAKQYAKNLESMLNQMGMNKEVKFFDLKSAMESQPDFKGTFQKAHREVEEILQNPGSLKKTIDHIYASAIVNIHPEKIPKRVGQGKLALQMHRKTTCIVPWMGVGVLDSKGATIKYEAEIRRKHKFRPLYIRGQKQPLGYIERGLYTKGSHHDNFIRRRIK